MSRTWPENLFVLHEKILLNTAVLFPINFLSVDSLICQLITTQKVLEVNVRSLEKDAWKVLKWLEAATVNSAGKMWGERGFKCCLTTQHPLNLSYTDHLKYHKWPPGASMIIIAPLLPKCFSDSLNI